MRAVGLTMLWKKLGAYVRGRTSDDLALAELVRRGWLTPPLIGRFEDVPTRPVVPLTALLEELHRDRADR